MLRTLGDLVYGAEVVDVLHLNYLSLGEREAVDGGCRHGAARDRAVLDGGCGVRRAEVPRFRWGVQGVNR